MRQFTIQTIDKSTTKTFKNVAEMCSYFALPLNKPSKDRAIEKLNESIGNPELKYQLVAEKESQKETKKETNQAPKIALTDEQKSQFMNLLGIETAIDKEQLEQLLIAFGATVFEQFDKKVDQVLQNGKKLKIDFKGIKTEVVGQHKEFETLLKVIATGTPVMLVGSAGTGKTTGASKVAECLNLPFYPQSVGAQTTKADLIGYPNAKGDYVTTIFRKAFEEGGVYLMDEIDAGNSNTITILNAALANGIMSFPDKVVKKHKDFYCIAAANTFGTGANRQYVGRNQLDAATLDRFVTLDWDIDEKIEENICTNHDWLKIVRAYRKAANDLGMRVVISPRASVYGSNLLQSGLKINKVMNMTIFKGLPQSDINKLKKAVLS